MSKLREAIDREMRGPVQQFRVRGLEEDESWAEMESTRSRCLGPRAGGSAAVVDCAASSGGICQRDCWRCGGLHSASHETGGIALVRLRP